MADVEGLLSRLQLRIDQNAGGIMHLLKECGPKTYSDAFDYAMLRVFRGPAVRFVLGSIP